MGSGNNPRRRNGSLRNKQRKILMARYDECPLCGLPLDKTLTNHLDPMYPVIDEIVPISRGGMLVLSNMQLVHRRCNARKGNKLMSELVVAKGRPPDTPHTTRKW